MDSDRDPPPGYVQFSDEASPHYIDPGFPKPPQAAASVHSRPAFGSENPPGGPPTPGGSFQPGYAPTYSQSGHLPPGSGYNYPPGYGNPPGYPQPYYPPNMMPLQQLGRPQHQQQQQVVIMGGGYSQCNQPIPIVQTFIGHIVLACFVFWCCFCLFGIAAFVLAILASNQAHSDPQSASTLGRASLIVSLVGVAVSIAVMIIVISVVVTEANSAYYNSLNNNNNNNNNGYYG